ncbi:APC family permease [Flavobacterium capsici]|uniref:APC family permease n=1 Tax=Flavobacterium capsici TaxID=3075618 RepID=A0AA96EX97_9FLAO|nr:MULTISPECIES: APC family permease [unclassified Flavobacterium]WNM18677.1 APC family permease [Flavobacterium sp. PMR2A8]WNM22728.1 APC family permease [Flavobacterium sp. PMTSA4]
MENNSPNHLKKILGVSFGIAILIGGTIGVGILRTPGAIAGLLDNHWLIISCWILGGIYVLLGCGAYSELATMFPKAGGSYNYVKHAFGNYFGFITGWFDYLTCAIAPAFFCIVISEYLVLLVPQWENHTTIIAIAFLLGFTLLHASGTKNGSLVQKITSVIKILLFVILIMACFSYSGVEIAPIKKSSGLLESSIIVSFFKSLQMVLGTYDGWHGVSFFAEEDENPSKNIPKSMYLGVLVVIIIYVIINLAFFYVLPVENIANSPLAAADVAKLIFGKKGSIVVTIIALFSIISILNAYMMLPSRVLYGMSRDGYFVHKGTIVNKGGTPIVALLFSSIFGFILICIGTFEILFSLATFMSVTVWLLTYITLIKLRISKPDLPRPHKSWGHPLTTIILILSTIAVFIGFAYSDRNSLVIIGIIMLFSYPVFLLLQKNHYNK